MPQRKKETPSNPKPARPVKSGGLENLSWFFTILLGAGLIAAILHLPLPGDKASALSLHVSTRYAQKAAAETGWAQGIPAVLADYRSFDLWAVSLFFFSVTLACLLPRLTEVPFTPLGGKAWTALLFSLLGLGSALGLGLYCLQGGSNFLDYEPLASWVGPSLARPAGALALGSAALLSLSGTLLAWWDQFKDSREVSRER